MNQINYTTFDRKVSRVGLAEIQHGTIERLHEQPLELIRRKFEILAHADICIGFLVLNTRYGRKRGRTKEEEEGEYEEKNTILRDEKGTRRITEK